MRLSARSEYGLLALIDMASAQDGRPLVTRDLAESRGIPSAFLEQLLADLRRAGLVRATRGPHGGFALARTAEEITALEIIEALEGPIAPSVCAPDACGREEGCAAASVWGDVSGAVRGALSGFTLARLAEEQTRLDRAPLTCSTRRSE
ncbi:MAG: Rrf2 family transcriptional regulator [Actinobacteria bacterium HGW-Actinobacteria-10]|jgi:Rrf2 family protein|nr:MAG: Rrf2 family transcriptional regulator [Actinobacteria bacterium HGW-Actinobacteria-10]